MIEGWYQEKEFKNDPAFKYVKLFIKPLTTKATDQNNYFFLSLIPTLYIDLKKNGVEFLPNTTSGNQVFSIDKTY